MFCFSEAILVPSFSAIKSVIVNLVFLGYKDWSNKVSTLATTLRRMRSYKRYEEFKLILINCVGNLSICYSFQQKPERRMCLSEGRNEKNSFTHKNFEMCQASSKDFNLATPFICLAGE